MYVLLKIKTPPISGALGIFKDILSKACNEATKTQKPTVCERIWIKKGERTINKQESRRQNWLEKQEAGRKFHSWALQEK